MRRILTATAVAALGLAPVFAVPMPGLAASDQSQMSPGQAAPQAMQAPSGGTLSSGTVDKAGAALHDLTKLDQKYQGQMASASPEQKQALNAKANTEAVQTIQSHGLSVQEYTNVIRMARNDPQLKQRLLNAAKSGD